MVACSRRRADRLRHGQGHRAGRRDRARRAARQDRREGGLPPRMSEPLVDGHGRPIGDVRISVTDRCNFRCQYCMPAEGLPWLDRDALLTYEEIARLVRAARRDGRPRRPPDRRRAARAQGAVAAGRDAVGARGRPRPLADHQRLPARRARSTTSSRAGLRRVNVSLDSLAPDRFFQLTRRDSLAAGARRASRPPQAPPGAAPDQGQRRRAARTSPRTRSCASPSSPASSPTRCASSSSCRSTPTGRGARDKVLPERGDPAR